MGTITKLGFNNINDIPAMLRRLADQIEAAKEDDKPSVVYVVIPKGELFPAVYCYGENDSDQFTLGVLELAKQGYVLMATGLIDGHDD